MMRARMNDDNNPGVSVIIPAYNGDSTLEMCITGLLEQDYEGPIEITVIDDCSEDSTLSIAERLGVKTAKHDVNIGLAASINEGIRRAIYNLVLILHQDCIIKSRKWISILVSELTSDPTIGVVSSPTFIPEKVFNSYSVWEKVRTSWMHEPLPRMSNYKEFNHGILDKCDLFSRKTFDIVGFFDSKHYRSYMEDYDMNERLRHSNYKILYVNIPVEHWDGWRKRYGLSRSIKKMYQASSASGVRWRMGRKSARQRLFELGRWLMPIIGMILLATPYALFAIPLLLVNTVPWAVRIHRRLHNYRLSLAAIALGLVALPSSTYGFFKSLVTSKQE